MQRGITLDQLRVFLMVVEHGSFSAAARAMRTAQSAVSYTIARLEDRLDVVLFDRATRVPTLTASGLFLVKPARDVLARVGSLYSAVRGK